MGGGVWGGGFDEGEGGGGRWRLGFKKGVGRWIGFALGCCST